MRGFTWKRFWIPREGMLNLGDGGYLPDPEGEWTRHYNPDVVPFESIEALPFLGLLGEPGMGKTYALQSLRKSIEAKVSDEGGRSLWSDLREYGDEGRLVEDIFECDSFKEWADGDHVLHLFLDSLDECRMRIGNLAAVLLSKLRAAPCDRLRLRIACRTADWPESLERGLRESWGSNSVGVWELAPLRRSDVSQAAASSGLNSDAFLEAVGRAEAVPLAIKPITLQFLISTFGKLGTLPSNQATLYLEGCRHLCEEKNESRRESGLVGALQASDRLAVAGHIAAVTAFANRAAVWVGGDSGAIPDGDVSVGSLADGSACVGDSKVRVTEEAVREVLGTGLFSSRGPNRLGWAHRTYSEFLAARHVLQQGMTLPQIENLFLQSDAQGKKLIPQLHGVAAWLGGMHRGFFNRVLDTDPDVLLRADVLSLDDSDRASLVESFLRMLDEQKVQFPGFESHQLYGKLVHPGLASQLRAFIFDKDRSVLARREAIDIAASCRAKELQEDLTAVALDNAQPTQVRIPAAWAVARFGDSEVRGKLRPLARGEAGDDPEDELKGCGLRAAWPEHLEAPEFFAILTLPKRENLFGAYKSFLRDGLVPYLSRDGLSEAVKWVAEQAKLGALHGAFEDLADDILLRAWDDLEFHGVLEPFAKAAAMRLDIWYTIGGEKLAKRITDKSAQDTSKRRRLIEQMVPLYTDVGKAVTSLCHYRTPLVRRGDVAWMLGRLQATKVEQEKRVWSRLILYVLDESNLEEVDGVVKACGHEKALSEEFSGLMWPVELGTTQADELRKRWVEIRRWDNGRGRERPLLSPPPQQRITKLLDAFEAGDPSAWWRLNMEMTLEPDSTRYAVELELDLRKLPGWGAASDLTRARLMEAALRYVVDEPLGNCDWLGTNAWHRPAVAACRALRLLAAEDPNHFGNLPDACFAKWAPAIIQYYPRNSESLDELQELLLRRCYAASPEDVIRALLQIVDHENSEMGHVFIMRTVERIWGERLANALAEKMKDPALKPAAMGDLLDFLLDRGVPEARSFAESLVGLPVPSQKPARQRSLLAAAALLEHSDNEIWERVWTVISATPEFGRELFTGMAHGPGPSAGLTQGASEGQLGRLYVWLEQNFPHTEDPKFDDAHAVGPRESLGHFRDAILETLKLRGTNEACAAIEDVIQELPQIEWLWWTLLSARALARQNSWVAPSAEEVIRLFSRPEVRLVQGGGQLLDVALESLERLQAKLQGETPAAPFLWDEVSVGVYRPKDENSLSNFVKLHLEEDLVRRGIVSNREVRIRQKTGGKLGEITDIHIDAVSPVGIAGSYDRVTVILETKGCWHPELETAMKTQLVERYLRDNRCNEGLYLVGWFPCSQWDSKDSRRSDCPKYDIEEAKRRFAAQAEELSQRGLRLVSFVLDARLR